MQRLTDRNAVRVALWTAIQSEESLIEAYRRFHFREGGRA